MLEDTPHFDIKPYIPEFDIFSVDRIGWYQNRKHKYQSSILSSQPATASIVSSGPDE